MVPGKRRKIYFDGGCRPNPGPMECAVVLGGRVQVFEDMGQGDNREAEWQALLEALELACAHGLTDVVLLGDSRGVIEEAQGLLAGAPASAPHAVRFNQLATGLPRLRVRWIKRAQNLAGIALARRHPR